MFPRLVSCLMPVEVPVEALTPVAPRDDGDVMRCGYPYLEDGRLTRVTRPPGEADAEASVIRPTVIHPTSDQ
jgi:hypothetical protein